MDMRFTENAEIHLQQAYATKTSTFSITVDRMGADADNIFNKVVLLMLTANVANDGSNYFTPTYLDSPDDSVYTATTQYTGSTMPAAFNHASNHDDKLYAIEYTGKQRYFKVTFTASSSPSMPCAFISILDHPERAPVDLQT
jgi:hypothetical protein